MRSRVVCLVLQRMDGEVFIRNIIFTVLLCIDVKICIKNKRILISSFPLIPNKVTNY